MATGYHPQEESKKVELFDITNPALTCTLPNFPAKLTFSTAGFTADGPLLCSGYDHDKNNNIDSCYHINSATGQFEKTKVSLKYKRRYAASIVTNTGLWILGGYRNGYQLKSTELVSATGVKDKNPLPIASSNACIVKINATTGIVTGGWKNKAKSTYYLDLTNFNIKPGPDMISERYRHGCSSFTFNGYDIAIVSGGKADSNSYLDSTEYLDTSKEDPKWEQGTV